MHRGGRSAPAFVGATGFEPATPCPGTKRATRLRYAPKAAGGRVHRAGRRPSIPSEDRQRDVHAEFGKGPKSFDDSGNLHERVHPGNPHAPTEKPGRGCARSESLEQGPGRCADHGGHAYRCRAGRREPDPPAVTLGPMAGAQWSRRSNQADSRSAHPDQRDIPPNRRIPLRSDVARGSYRAEPHIKAVEIPGRAKRRGRARCRSRRGIRDRPGGGQRVGGCRGGE